MNINILNNVFKTLKKRGFSQMAFRYKFKFSKS